MQTRTWYLAENDFATESFCIPGVRLSDAERVEAQGILRLSLQECGDRFGGYRILVPGLGADGASISVRGHRIMTQKGPFHALREIPNVVPKLNGVGFVYEPWVQRLLLSPDLSQGGLVLISGSAGTGKSTTMAATLVSRLQTYGSMAISLEDPPEYRLQGLHGQGSCLQMPAASPDEFAGLIMDALRCYPAGMSSMMLMISEIRNPQTAALAVEAALSGHLIITSIHAASIESSIGRLTSMAGQELGVQSARGDAGEAIKICIHQKRMGKAIKFTALKNIGDYSVATKIREGQMHLIGADIQKQMALNN